MSTEAVPHARAIPALRTLADRVAPLTPAHLRCLPLTGPMEPLFPGGGLPRGSLVVTGGQAGATTLALALAAGPSRTGSWVAVVGFPQMGWEAASEVGLALDHLLAVPDLGRQGPSVVAAMLDAVDVVLCGPGVQPTAAQSRRLRARARERGAVLVAVNGAVTTSPGGHGRRVHGWEGADARLGVSTLRWEGLGQGWGHLGRRRLVVVAEGRGALSRAGRHEIVLDAGAPVAHRSLVGDDREDRARMRRAG